MRTGTTASRAASGGASTIGRNKNSTRIASTDARHAASTARCLGVSGASGRRYSTYVTAAIAAASRTASHQGNG